MDPDDIIVRIADSNDAHYARTITDEMEDSAIKRGTGISKRSPESIIQKMEQGKAVIALTRDGEWVGFSYIEVWSNGEFVSNSGLIVNPAYRNRGVAAAIKEQIFLLSREKYPGAKIFSITTGLAIMKMNARLGFETVTYSELTKEKTFWEGCKSCVNYNILQDKHCTNCLCTAMLYDNAGYKL
ncbi:MAG: GNAT family N-acetyltransferase [Chitinophagaceae bacterium]